MTYTPFQIIYEDKQIIVCEKPHGIATQSKRLGSPDMVSLLKNHLHKTSGSAVSKEPYLAVIHRLDQPVRGILVFAKTPAAARELSRQLGQSGFGKYYRALVEEAPGQPEGALVNYMVKDAKTNTSRICTKDTPGAKQAKLYYKTIDHKNRFFAKAADISGQTTELEIKLDTGRHHQIRCQLAHIGCPIAGDTKYNPRYSPDGKWRQICLCACCLEFTHPTNHKPMRFELPFEHV